MNQLDYERRQQVSKRREASEASNAVDVLLGLGWTSATFADVAAGLKKKEQANGSQPLRKLVTSKSNRGK
jgi:hypothetical protein